MDRRSPRMEGRRMNITDDAVDAAREAYLAYPVKRGLSSPSDAMRAALEAAAPRLMARAWDECAKAYEARRKEPGSARTPPLANPYRSAGGGE